MHKSISFILATMLCVFATTAANAKNNLKVSSATYDGVLHELRITWKTPATSDYKGVDVKFKKLNGVDFATRIKADEKFPTSYKFFTVVTGQPKDVTYRYVWNKDGKEVCGKWMTTAKLKIKDESATARFSNLIAPKYTLVPVPKLDNNYETVVKGYDQLAGNTDSEKEAYFTNVLKSVLSAAYFSTEDAGVQPVKTLHCYVDKIDWKGVYAYVSWDDKGPLVKLGYNVLSDQVNKGGINFVDWKGVCLHEFTHLIQAMPPQDAGTETDRMTCQEGYADAIRVSTGGFPDAQRIASSFKAISQPYYQKDRNDHGLPYPYIWQAKYQISGFFMSWLRYYDGDILRKITASAKIVKPWSLENAVKYILGNQADIKTLWEEYAKDVRIEKEHADAANKK